MTTYPKIFRSIGQIFIELMKIYSYMKKHWNSFVTHYMYRGYQIMLSGPSVGDCLFTIDDMYITVISLLLVY